MSNIWQNAKKEIKTPDALKGVKLRLPEIPDWVAVWKEALWEALLESLLP